MKQIILAPSLAGKETLLGDSLVAFGADGVATGVVAPRQGHGAGPRYEHPLPLNDTQFNAASKDPRRFSITDLEAPALADEPVVEVPSVEAFLQDTLGGTATLGDATEDTVEVTTEVAPEVAPEPPVKVYTGNRRAKPKPCATC